MNATSERCPIHDMPTRECEDITLTLGRNRAAALLARLLYLGLLGFCVAWWLTLMCALGAVSRLVFG